MQNKFGVEIILEHGNSWVKSFPNPFAAQKFLEARQEAARKAGITRKVAQFVTLETI
jgi:hypothetical protein